MARILVRPVRIYPGAGVAPRHVRAVADAVRIVLATAGIERPNITIVPAQHMRQRRHAPRTLSLLANGTSWLIAVGEAASGRRGQVCGETVIACMADRSEHSTLRTHDVLVLAHDLVPEHGGGYRYGIGQEGVGCVVSTTHLRDTDALRYVAAHEFGHVLGLANIPRASRAPPHGETSWTHCPDPACLMFGIGRPASFKRAMRRFRDGGELLCTHCLHDLQTTVRQP